MICCDLCAKRQWACSLLWAGLYKLLGGPARCGVDQLQCSPEAGPQRHHAPIHYQQAPREKRGEHLSAHFRPLVCCPGETLMLPLQFLAFCNVMRLSWFSWLHKHGKELHTHGKDT